VVGTDQGRSPKWRAVYARLSGTAEFTSPDFGDGENFNFVFACSHGCKIRRMRNDKKHWAGLHCSTHHAPFKLVKWRERSHGKRKREEANEQGGAAQDKSRN